MEEEKNLAEVSNETEVKQETKLFKKPEGKAMYQKHRDDVDDAETEAFARGELNKFNEEKAETATVQKDTETSEEIASSDGEATPSTERPENAEDRVFKKRYDDLKKHYDSTLFKHKDEVRTLRTQLETSTKEFVPPKSKDELEAWRKEYPDVYEMVETIAMTKADTRAKEIEEKYQNLAIDLYKMDNGTSKLSKKQETSIKKEAAKAVTKTTKATDTEIPTKKIWSNSEIARMNPRTFAKYEAEIDEATREGRIQP